MAVKDAVLQALEEARGARISGGALAETLGVSRAAVWKAIDALRAGGLKIDAVPGEGYLLEADDDSLTEAGISALLQTEAFGRTCLILPSLSSTNTVLKQDYLDRPHGFALIAEEQTGGRGRLGRTFSSPAGTGLYLSMLLHPQLPLDRLNLLTIAAAVAVCDAIEQTAGFSPEIKWVNDVLMHGKKLCGILTEATIEGETGAIGAVVVGIGINLRDNPAWPEEVRTVAGSLADFGTPPRRAVLAAAVLEQFEHAYQLLESGDSAVLLERYRRRLCCIGKAVTVMTPAAKYEAICTGLDENGHLLVQDAQCTAHTLSSGEISIRLST